MREERKREMLEEWTGQPSFPHIVLSRRLLEEVGEEEGGEEIVIDLFDELKIENYNDKMATDTFLPSVVSDQALILPFFSAEAMAISEVATF